MSVFPKELNYGQIKPISKSGSPQIVRFRSDLATYTGGDTIRIAIPTGRSGQHLFPQDSYISLSVRNPHAASITFKGSVFSLFSRMRILHGSSVLEDTNYCGNLWNALLDVNYSYADRASLSLTHGIAEQLTAATPVGAVNTTVNTPLGRTLTTGDSIATTVTSSYTFELPSAVLGTLCSKAIPLSQLGASDLYLELTLNSQSTAFFSAAAVDAANVYVVSEIYYNAKITKLPPDVESALLNSVNSSFIIPAYSWRGEQKSVSPTATAFSTINRFSFNTSSTKNFVFWFTTTAGLSAYDSYGLATRNLIGLNEFQLQFNGESYPSYPISRAQFPIELKRAFDGTGTTNYKSAISRTDYFVDLTSPTSRTVVGIDLDKYNGTSEMMLSGTNLVGQNFDLLTTHSAVANNTVAHSLFAYVMHDVILTINGGVMTVSI